MYFEAKNIQRIPALPKLALWLAVFFLGSISPVHGDVSVVLEKAEAAYSKQKHLVLQTEVELPFGIQQKATITTVGETTESQTEEFFYVYSEGGVLRLKQQTAKLRGRKFNQQFVYFENEDYGATLISKGVAESRFYGLGSIAGNTFTMSHYWNADLEATNVAMMNELTGLYLKFGRVEFDLALQSWRENGGQVAFVQSDVSAENLHELHFEGWPIGNEGKASYYLHPENFYITKIVVSLENIDTTYMAEEFSEIGGSYVPTKTVLKNTSDRIPGFKSLTKTTSWVFNKDIIDDYDPASLTLEFYGLSPLSMAVLPQERSWKWLIYAFASMGLIAIFLLAYKLMG